MADTKDTPKGHGTKLTINDKAGKHPAYYQGVEVTDINGFSFTINSTVPGPHKVESSYKSHPAYNPDLKIEKVAKGRVEQYQERLKKMQAMKNAA